MEVIKRKGSYKLRDIAGPDGQSLQAFKINDEVSAPELTKLMGQAG